MSNNANDRDDSGGLQCEFQESHAQARVISVDVRLEPVVCSSDFGSVLSPSAVRVISPPLETSKPRAISISVFQPVVKIRSFVFSLQPEQRDRTAQAPKQCAGQSCGAIAPLEGRTRIKPPGDVIKLEDRLQYVLQPSLESLLSESSLTFPCRPYQYQFAGAAFLFPRHAAILADEMGLGKTMQAITAIRLLLRYQEARSILLVCPKPLVTNWQREFQQWAPELPLMTIEGDQPKRVWQWLLADVPLRIANYEILLRDRELFENDFSQSQRPPFFDLVLLDESQRIKNRDSTTNQIICSIPRRRSWALTGTPVENSTNDLVGIFEFLAPGFLSPDMSPRKMGRTVSDYILRRSKDQVLTDLPPKIVHDEYLELTPGQRETYNLAEDEGVLRLNEMGASATIQHVFELVLRLKQICNFDTLTGQSAKLERLSADLEEISQSGRKAIVFSQWVGTLKKLSRHLAQFGPLEYHGGVPSRRRDAVIERFRADERSHVLLMTYGAGGVGLNLQFANYVFLFDRWWNPAVEDQAINRAHRIGIDGPAYVTRFLMLDTIEQRIDAVLQAKRELFEAIFSEDSGQRKMGLSQEELFGLFQLKCPGGPIDIAA